MKRFSETTRFDEPWYADLPPVMKCAFEFMWARADNSGVWSVNKRLAEFQIGSRVDWAAFVEKTQGRVLPLSDTEWFLAGFVEMQCGKLSKDSRPHQVVIELLRKRNLLSDSLCIVYPKGSLLPLNTIQVPVTGEGQGLETPRASKVRGTLDEVVSFCVELGLPAADGEACFHKWEGNGWTNGKAQIKDWRSTIRSWRAAEFLPSQKHNGKQRRTSADIDAAKTGIHSENIPFKRL